MIYIWLRDILQDNFGLNKPGTAAAGALTKDEHIYLFLWLSRRQESTVRLKRSESRLRLGSGSDCWSCEGLNWVIELLTPVAVTKESLWGKVL